MVDPNGNQHEFFDGIIPIQHDTTGVNQNTFFDLVDTADVVEFTVVVEEFFTTTQVALLVNPPNFGQYCRQFRFKTGTDRG